MHLLSPTSRLASTSMLWFTFVLTIVCTLAFVLLAQLWDIRFIDGIADPEQARQLLAQYRAEQKTAHAWTTATLDVAYPLLYGSLFAGLALRFFQSPLGSYLALPGLLAIPVDLTEGVIQVLALTNTIDWLHLKAWVTPLKSGLFITGLLLALAGWLKWLYLKLRSR